jgi:hypothetical protein
MEQYWNEEWNTIEDDFEEMKAPGANTVRVHLQVSAFMKSATELIPRALHQLSRLVALAEGKGLRLDITGLGCYDKTAVPAWYNALEEADRWQAQARFWQGVAKTCAKSPAIFCYDLMNEPVVTEDKATRDWTPGAFGNRYFVQRITLNFKDREPRQIARAWIEKLTAAIRKEDERHLITVGAIPWALTWPGAKPLFYSETAGKNLDFVSVHFYPKSGEIDSAIKALSVYNIGKPIVIEETFPLHCSLEELDDFISRSRPIAAGWIGFYWGKTINQYQNQKRDLGEEITLKWLNYFSEKAPLIQSTNRTKSQGRSPSG